MAAVPTQLLAELPEGVSYTAGAALPVAGLTALQAVRAGGFLAGRTVLITGAAGGVGRLAVQLAAAGGARVLAVVGRGSRASAVSELGLPAVEVVVGDPAPTHPVDLVLESVGGDSLTSAFDWVVDGGTIVSYGRSSGQPGQVPPGWFLKGSRLLGLRYVCGVDGRPTGPEDLAVLADLVARGRLDPGVSREADWLDTPALVEALLDRKVAGKAVLLVRA